MAIIKQRSFYGNQVQAGYHRIARLPEIPNSVATAETRLVVSSYVSRETYLAGSPPVASTLYLVPVSRSEVISTSSNLLDALYTTLLSMPDFIGGTSDVPV
jgi:hypothetical protein